MFDNRRIRRNGLTAQALVLSAKEHSTFSSNEKPRYDFVLEVRPQDRAPFQAHVRQAFYIAERKPREADVVQVKYEPSTLKVIFDLEGDPRFDLEAMNRRTSQLSWETYRLRETAAAAATQPQPQDRVEALQRLAALHASGAISDVEYAALKAEILKGL
jgi:hypothetical protein